MQIRLTMGQKLHWKKSELCSLSLRSSESRRRYFGFEQTRDSLAPESRTEMRPLRWAKAEMREEACDDDGYVVAVFSLLA